MFVIFSNHWKPDRATGQERLLADCWFELVADDTSPLYWPPLFSTLQLLRNLRQLLTDVNRGVLFPYHIRDVTTELQDRLKNGTWLESEYPGDLVLLKEQFIKLRGAHSDSPGVADADKKSKEAQQKEVRQVTSLLLTAFIAKVERDGPLDRQRVRLADLTADSGTSFDIIVRAAAELTNDLLHTGHSRDHVHQWMLRGVLGDEGGRPYLVNLRETTGIGSSHAAEYRVAFRVFATPEVPDFGGISLLDEIPAELGIPGTSKLREVSQGRFAIVEAPGCLDIYAAIDRAREVLMRYFASTRLERYPFDRTISPYAVAWRPDTKEFKEVEVSRGLATRSLHNDAIFYDTPAEGRDEHTFAELDRVLYWLEQSRRWDDTGRLIALWTAMEFLFSKQGKSAAEAIIETLPAYIVPQYPRLLIRDFATFFSKVRLEVPDDLRAELKARKRRRGGYSLGNLPALLGLAQEKEAGDRILPLLAEHPVLVRKWMKVRRLNPTRKAATASYPDVWIDVDRFESGLEFDLQFAYRVRNSIVHDAATSILQSRRLVQRLQWMLCATLDSLFYQFSRNPSLTLAALHEVNVVSYLRWNQALKDTKTPIALSEIHSPTVHCIS